MPRCTRYYNVPYVHDSDNASDIMVKDSESSGDSMSVDSDSLDEDEIAMGQEAGVLENNTNSSQSVPAHFEHQEIPRSSFMVLPPEIRQQVYDRYMDSALDGVFPIRHRYNHGRPRTQRLGLLRVSKTIHNELMPQVYDDLRFASFTAAAIAFRQMGIANIGEIRRLIIDMGSIVDEHSAEFVFSTLSCSKRRGGRLLELSLDIGTALGHLDNNAAFCQGQRALSLMFHPRSRLFRQLKSIHGLDDFWISYEPWQSELWNEIWARSNWLSDRYIADIQWGFEQVIRSLSQPIRRQLPQRIPTRAASV